MTTTDGRNAAMRMLLVFAVSSAACNAASSGMDANPGTGGSNDIGAAGGTVALAGGAAVTIPPGALGSTTTISVAPSPTAPPPAMTPDGSMYAFGPDGTIFLRPVTVSLPVSSPAAGKTIYWSRPDGGWDQLDATAATATLSAQVTHLSSGFVGAASASPPPAYFTLGGSATSGGTVRVLPAPDWAIEVSPAGSYSGTAACYLSGLPSTGTYTSCGQGSGANITTPGGVVLGICSPSVTITSLGPVIWGPLGPSYLAHGTFDFTMWHLNQGTGCSDWDFTVHATF